MLLLRTQVLDGATFDRETRQVMGGTVVADFAFELPEERLASFQERCAAVAVDEAAIGVREAILAANQAQFDAALAAAEPLVVAPEEQA